MAGDEFQGDEEGEGDEEDTVAGERGQGDGEGKGGADPNALRVGTERVRNDRWRPPGRVRRSRTGGQPLDCLHAGDTSRVVPANGKTRRMNDLGRYLVKRLHHKRLGDSTGAIAGLALLKLAPFIAGLAVAFATASGILRFYTWYTTHEDEAE